MARRKNDDSMTDWMLELAQDVSRALPAKWRVPFAAGMALVACCGVLIFFGAFLRPGVQFMRATHQVVPFPLSLIP
jgi:hypothetical protein